MSYIYPIKSFRKATIERRRFYLDYSCWLAETEKLTDVQALISPYTAEAPIIVSSGYTDATNKKLTMFVSGGVGNTNYTIQMVVKTDGGQTKRDDIGILVTP